MLRQQRNLFASEREYFLMPCFHVQLLVVFSRLCTLVSHVYLFVSENTIELLGTVASENMVSDRHVVIFY